MLNLSSHWRSRLHVATGHTDLVDDVAVLGDKGILRFTSQHVNVAHLQVALFVDISKKWSEAQLGNSATCLILIQRAAASEGEVHSPSRCRTRPSGGDLSDRSR